MTPKDWEEAKCKTNVDVFEDEMTILVPSLNQKRVSFRPMSESKEMLILICKHNETKKKVKTRFMVKLIITKRQRSFFGRMVR